MIGRETIVNMDRASIESGLVVERYLAGQLSAAEESEFDKYASDCPEIYREVENVLRLKEGLAQLQERGKLSALLRKRNWGPRWAAVAAVMLVALAVWSLYNTRVHDSILARSSADLVGRGANSLPVAGSYALVRSRGSDSIVNINLPATRAAIELHWLPSTYAKETLYRATLELANSTGELTVVANISGLGADSDRYVRLYLDSGKFTPGSYVILLSEVEAGQSGPEPDRFELELKRP